MSILSGRKKVFKDPVHGYISVPMQLCTHLIDTPIFQRLRHIEQTSMRPLYPAAHHDRFIHSLGVFHLGQCVYSSLKSAAHNNSNTLIAEILNDEILENTFLIACLMHDCGHAPFSHTFENFYNYKCASDTKRAYERLRSCFPADYFEITASFEPAPHEAFSAIVLKEFYFERLAGVNIDCDINLAAQMITGCTYPVADSIEKQVHNQLIKLLSGDAIDVDKLDYILRDTWSSGVNNISIDVDRLISAMMLCEENGSIELCYHKSALSVIQSVVDARNYLYRWIYTHHTILYYFHLLDLSLRRAAKMICPSNQDDFWQSVFSEDSFKKCMPLGNAFIYLPTDGDILYILKSLLGETPIANVDSDVEKRQFEKDMNEFLAHSPTRVPLWKTYAEFRHVFEGRPFGNIQTKPRLKELVESLPARIASFLDPTFSPDDVIVVQAEAKTSIIREGDIKILLDNSLVSFTQLFGQHNSINPPPMHFFAFIPTDCQKKSKELIAFLQKQDR